MEPGIYLHYKGRQYEVVGVARHSESMEEMVIYKALYDSPGFGYGALWVRPKTMFEEEIEVIGEKVQRFRKIK
jgi:hypothetical protein